MENNAGRGKKILSLMMIRAIIIISLSFLTGCCKKIIINPPTPQKVSLPPGLNYIITYDTIYYWSSNINDDSYTPLKIILKDFNVISNKLYDKNKKELNNVIISFKRKGYTDISSIKKGIPKYWERIYEMRGDATDGLTYDEQGNIKIQYNIDTEIEIKSSKNDSIYYINTKIPYRVQFYEGSGQWRTFYYGGLDKNYQYVSGPLKEEGEVKNNFKFGEWKYYNKEGKIDSIKNYTLEDSVDVRFPYCIFNKKEPCY